jgi:hypothetical protein
VAAGVQARLCTDLPRCWNRVIEDVLYIRNPYAGPHRDIHFSAYLSSTTRCRDALRYSTGAES